MAKDPRYLLKFVNRSQVFQNVKKSLDSKVNLLKYQAKTATTIKDVLKIVPSTTVAEFNNIYRGAHIRFGGSGVYSHHAIVTNIDDDRKLKVIEINCDQRHIPEHKAEIREQTIVYDNYGDVLMVNYQENSTNCFLPQFTRIPHQASVAVAQYFKENPDALQAYTSTRQMDTCEHFAVTCTLGYSFSFQQLKRIIIAAGALTMIDNGVIHELLKYMMTRRVVSYDKENHNLKVILESGKEVIVPFKMEY